MNHPRTETPEFPQPTNDILTDSWAASASYFPMGQSPSTPLSSLENNRGDSSATDALEVGIVLDLLPPASTDFVERVGDSDLTEDDAADVKDVGHDYTVDLPVECLEHVFHFLGSGDRKRCSLVCRRWLDVDGQNRHRLSLDARSELLSFIPSIFARFDSVSKLSLRCGRKSTSINDDALILVSLKCPSLSRFKLRGCRALTDFGVAIFAQNAKNLRKFSLGSCSVGAQAINAVLNRRPNLEEISIKRLRGINSESEPIVPGAAANSLRSICLKEITHGQCFAPLIIGAKKLKTLKLMRCLGNWDTVFQTIGSSNQGLIEVHLERIQVTDVGLAGISCCKGVESLHIVKVPECSNLGLCSIAESCRKLRKLYIDGWRINRIGDEALVAVARNCSDLQELVLIGVNATQLSLSVIASNCQKLERLALCGSDSFGDAEIACIGTKCVSLKKLCIKSCPITDVGIESLAVGCPNLSKIKVKKCRGVSNQVAEWLRERKPSLVFNIDVGINDEVGVPESPMELTPMFTNSTETAPSSSNERSIVFRAKCGILASRNLVAFTFRRWSNSGYSSSSNL